MDGTAIAAHEDIHEIEGSDSLYYFVRGLLLTSARNRAFADHWRLGTFDQSSAEFSGDSPSQPVTFVIDQSVAGKDWYADAPSFFSSRKPDTASAAPTIQFHSAGLDRMPIGFGSRCSSSTPIDICLYSAPTKAVAAERLHKKRDARIVRASLRKLIRIACS
jgi:hypothetical protein